MTRTRIALAAVLACMLFVPTWISAKGTEPPAQHMSGTITAWNASAKKLTVKDTAGKETTIVWNDKTIVKGTPQVGAPVNVAYTKGKNETINATTILSGAKPAPKSVKR